MTTTVQKDLDWIGQAPVSFSGSATTTASPEAVFAVLADHERWPEWFPVIKSTEVLGTLREGVGMRRVTTIPGGKIEERIIVWDPGQRWAFTATAVSPGIVHALLEDCRIEPADGGARVTYAIYLDPVAPLRPINEIDEGADAQAARRGHAGPRRPRRGALNILGATEQTGFDHVMDGLRWPPGANAMKKAFGLTIPRTLDDVCNPRDMALLVYDMQVGIVSQVSDGAALTARVHDVLTIAREAGMRACFTRHLSLPREFMGSFQYRTAMSWQRIDSPDEVRPWFLRDSPGFQIVPELAPLQSEPVFDKIAMSALACAS